MIDPRHLVAAIERNDIRLVAGVPDSLLGEACAAITASLPDRHVIAANEGAAVGMAIGSTLATGRPALVYMQNSGLGNAVNPLASLADPAIYGVPMVLLVGWRGEMQDGAQLKDEPQHVTQGRITPGQLELLGIPARIVDAGSDIDACLDEAVRHTLAQSRPVALLVRRGAFAAFPREKDQPVAVFTREAAIAAVVAALPAEVPIVATTGMASRELFELRANSGAGHDRDFLTVGGMGHAVAITTGIARSRPGRHTVCLDGDGAMLMHLGALTESAIQPGLLHVVLNNGAHDSVGGQPTAASRLDLCAIARSCGYSLASRAVDAAGIAACLDEAVARPGSSFIEIACRRGARKDLGRPTRSPLQNKHDFASFLARTA